MNHDLQGKTAIITGASRGIGRAIALELGSRGMRLGLLARSEKQLEETAVEVSKLGGEALTGVCDLGDLGAVEASLEQLIAGLTSVDVLVNNAGMFHESALIDQELDSWEEVLRVNLTAPMLICRQVLPLMMAAGGGRIINIASTSAIQGYHYQSAYCASKHGLLGLARCLALEVKQHDIHIHTLCPGGVDTELITGTQLGRRLAGQPLIAPQDIAAAVSFLISQPNNIDISELVIRRFIAK